MLAEIARLKRAHWSTLERIALNEAGISLSRLRKAKTRDELRLEILKAKFPGSDASVSQP